MQDSTGIPACFSASPSSSSSEAVPEHVGAVARSGQSVYMSVYRTKIGDKWRLITITWCKNLLLNGLSISISGAEGEAEYTCKVELKPWYFWRKQGSKRFAVEGKEMEVFWDLKSARFNGETEPSSEYYVAVVCEEEVVLVVGDLKKEAYRRTGCRPALMDPILVSKKEHVFGKKRFCTKAKFHEKGKWHEISIECKGKGNANGDSVTCGAHHPQMEIRIDGHVVIHVTHLHWKFRGNESVHFTKMRVEIFWDVHDWLFTPGLKHALFIFKPVFSPPHHHMLPPHTTTDDSAAGFSVSGSSEFCLFIYAWKVE